MPFRTMDFEAIAYTVPPPPRIPTIRPDPCDTYLESGLRSVLWAIIVLLVIFWVVGLAAHIAGVFINVLLFIAIAVLAYDLFIRRRRA